jgi:glucose/arabinose dehydrogenase
VRRFLLLAAVVATVAGAAPAVSPAAAGVPNAALAPSRPPLPAATVPSGFTDSLVTSSTSVPVAVTALPDGRALILQKAGSVRVIRNGALVATPAIDLNQGGRAVCSNYERGLLGITPDPAFGSNGHLYVYYSRLVGPGSDQCVNTVSRFTMTGDTIASASELVLLDYISSLGNHSGGDVAIGNDGFLYVAVGDNGCDPRGDSGCAGGNDAAQDLSLLSGKILRVDRTTGAPAPGNPFSGPGTAVCRTRGNTDLTPTTICREIFASGLRNPWRFAFDPNTGATTFHINDVGQGTREEVNLGVLGANYGWPAREGQCAQGENPPCPPPDGGLGFTEPITDYQHGTGNYVTGGAFVPNGAWPASFDGGYLFADGNPGSIFFRDAAGDAPNYDSPFATGGAGISDIEFVMEPGGWALYYVQTGAGSVRKIVYDSAPAASPGNLAFNPVAPSQRVYDTRSAGADSGAVRAGSSRLINVVATQGDHRAALVNITMVRPSATAFVTAWQPRTTKPTASNINAATGQIAANASIVPIDADGNVLLFVSATSHLIVDVLGFFDTTIGGAAQAGRLVPTTPIRAADTREAANGTTNQYTRTTDGLDEVVNVPIEGEWGVGTDTSAVALIVTGIAALAPARGYVVALPHGGTIPSSSNVNTNGGGEVRSNLVIVPVGADGSVDLRLRTTAHVLVDVVGSFTDGTAPTLTDGTFVPLAPTRVVDTRIALGFNRTTAVGGGYVNPSVVPDDAMAVAQNIVVVRTGGPGFLTAYPTFLARPNVSNVNANGPNQTRSAMAITMVGFGQVQYYTSFATDVVVDVTGYFNPETF